jgi:YfiR/HmsC-like
MLLSSLHPKLAIAPTLLSRKLCLLALLGTLAMSSIPSYSNELNNKEDIEAAMAIAASKFVSWPTPISSSFNICVSSDNKLSQAIRNHEGKHLKGSEIKVLALSDTIPIINCHIIMIDLDTPHPEKILDSIKNLPIMTIADTPGFVQSGGTMGFVIVNNKVRFEINLESAKKAGLVLSSQMLELAVYVKGSK